MNSMNAAYPPNNINPLVTPDNNTKDVNALDTPMHSTTHQAHPHAGTESDPTHATTGAHVATEGQTSKIKTALHDMKETVKGTLQRDHHHGQDCAKRPQDGKTNPME